MIISCKYLEKLGGRTASSELADDEAGQPHTTKEVEERRIREAYNILETNSYE